jgi:hypothetical protein
MLAAVIRKNAVFWDMALILILCESTFRRKYRFHLKSRTIRERGTSVSRWLQTEPPVENTIPRSQIFLSWRCRRYVFPKRRFTQYLYCATYQKTELFLFEYICNINIWGFHDGECSNCNVLGYNTAYSLRLVFQIWFLCAKIKELLAQLCLLIPEIAHPSSQCLRPLRHRGSQALPSCAYQYQSHD